MLAEFFERNIGFMGLFVFLGIIGLSVIFGFFFAKAGVFVIPSSL